MLNSVIIHVNSRNRISGTDSNFSYEIKLDATKSYDRVVVLQASVPKTYYLIQSGRNTFGLLEGEVKTPVTVTVPEGNYSASSFATVVGALLTLASPNSLTYTITPPTSVRATNTGKFTFTVRTAGGGIPSSTVSFVIGEYLFEQLGFDENMTVDFDVSGNLTSANVVNFQLEDTLFIHSDICNNSNDNILQELNASNTPDFGKIEYTAYYPPMWSRAMTSNSSNKYNFSITDEDGQLMNLNGRNLVLTLLVYKEDHLVREYAKTQLLQLMTEK